MKHNEDQLFQLLIRNLRKENDEKIALRKLGVAVVILPVVKGMRR